MIRSVKISLKYATKKKIRRLLALTSRLRKFTNECIDYMWRNNRKEDFLCYKKINCSCNLSHRQLQSCSRQAVSIVKQTIESLKTDEFKTRPSIPKLVNSVTLSAQISLIDKDKVKGFNYLLKIAGLKQYSKIIIPFKSHKRLNYWLSHPGAKLKNGCIISKDCKTATLWIDVPTPQFNEVGGELGFDINYATNLLTDSKGKVYGEVIKEVCENIRRKQPGSNNRKKACRFREQYINKVLKQIPWEILKCVAFENLKNLKKGKNKKRSKLFRKKIAPWTYRQVLTRSTHLAEENGVCLLFVDPKDTSKRCPRCSVVRNENRQGERFCCQNCGYSTSSGHAAAQNIIAKTCGNYQELIVPDSLNKKSKTKITDNIGSLVEF